MPYEHERQPEQPKPPAWSVHPASGAVAWALLFAFGLALALRRDAPSWLIVGYVVLAAFALSKAVWEVRRRRTIPQ